MPYDEGVAQRLREAFAAHAEIVEKKMFGGIAFMHAGNMCCGVVNDCLMARVGPDGYDAALAQPHAREMDFTGKSMKGFVYVDPAGFGDDAVLADWVERCLGFTRTLPPK